MVQILIEPADPLGPAAAELVQQMVAEIPPRYGEVLDEAAAAERAGAVLAANAAFLGERSVFLLAVAGEQAIGCGGIQPIAVEDDQETGPLTGPFTGEVKRMYVVKNWRRRGVGAAILAALEERARLLGYRRLVLETGNRQPEAVALYTAGGWLRIAPFGPYVDDPTSVCFEKRLYHRTE